MAVELGDSSKYLMNSLNEVLTRALHEVCQARPPDPIEFLAKCLYKATDCDLYFQEKAIYAKEMQLVSMEMKREDAERRHSIFRYKKDVSQLKRFIRTMRRESSFYAIRGQADAPKKKTRPEESMQPTPTHEQAETVVQSLAASVSSLLHVRRSGVLKSERRSVVSLQTDSSSLTHESDSDSYLERRRKLQHSRSETASSRGSPHQTGSSDEARLSRSFTTGKEARGGRKGKKLSIEENDPRFAKRSDRQDRPPTGKRSEKQESKVTDKKKQALAGKEITRKGVAKPAHGTAKGLSESGKQIKTMKRRKSEPGTEEASSSEDDESPDRKAWGTRRQEKVRKKQVKETKPAARTKYQTKTKDHQLQSEYETEERRDSSEEEEEEEWQEERGVGHVSKRLPRASTAEHPKSKTVKQPAKAVKQPTKAVKQPVKNQMRRKTIDDELENVEDSVEDDRTRSKSVDYRSRSHRKRSKSQGQTLPMEAEGRKHKRGMTHTLKFTDEPESDESLTFMQSMTSRSSRTPSKFSKRRDTRKYSQISSDFSKRGMAFTKKGVDDTEEDEYRTRSVSSEDEKKSDHLEVDESDFPMRKKKHHRKHTIKGHESEEYTTKGELSDILSKPRRKKKVSSETEMLEAEDKEDRIEEARTKHKKRKKADKERRVSDAYADEDAVREWHGSHRSKSSEATNDVYVKKKERKSRKKHSFTPDDNLDEDMFGGDVFAAMKSKQAKKKRQMSLIPDAGTQLEPSVKKKTKKKRHVGLLEDESEPDLTTSQERRRMRIAAHQEQGQDEKKSVHETLLDAYTKRKKKKRANDAFDEIEDSKTEGKLTRRKKGAKKKEEDSEAGARGSSSNTASSESSASSTEITGAGRTKLRERTTSKTKMKRDRKKKTLKSPTETSKMEITTPSEDIDISLSVPSSADAEWQPAFTPVECEWILQAPRVLVCIHPILGELRAHPVSVSSAKNYIGWPDRMDYVWQAFYDPEVYTMIDPYADETRFLRRRASSRMAQDLRLKSLFPS